MWHCLNCGQDNEDAAMICSACNALWPEQEQVHEQAQEQAPEQDQESGQEQAQEPKQEVTALNPPKKKMWPWVLGIAAGVLLLVGVIAGILIVNSPASKVLRATRKTIAGLQEEIGQTDTFHQWVNSVTAINEAPGVQCNLSLAMESPALDKMEVNTDFSVDLTEKRVGGNITLALMQDVNITLSLYGDQAGMSFSVPRLLEDVLFSYTYNDVAAYYQETLGMEITGDQINPFTMREQAQDPLVAAKAEAVKAAFDELLSHIKVEVSKNYTPASPELTAYTLVIRPEDREHLATALEDYTNTLFPNSLPETDTSDLSAGQVFSQVQEFVKEPADPMVCINKQGYLSYICISDTELSLLGENSPWSEGRLTIEGKELLQFAIEGGTDSVTFHLKDEAKSATLTYKDADGTFILTTANGDTYTGCITAPDGKAHFSLVSAPGADPFSLSFSMGKSTQSPTPLTGGTVYNPFNMTDEDKEALSTKLVFTLLSDPELLQLITGATDLMG